MDPEPLNTIIAKPFNDEDGFQRIILPFHAINITMT